MAAYRDTSTSQPLQQSNSIDSLQNFSHKQDVRQEPLELASNSLDPASELWLIELILRAIIIAVAAGTWAVDQINQGITQLRRGIEEYLKNHPNLPQEGLEKVADGLGQLEEQLRSRQIPGAGEVRELEELLRSYLPAKELTPDEQRHLERIDATGGWIKKHPDLPEEAEYVKDGGTLPEGGDHVEEARQKVEMLNKSIEHLSRVRPFRTPEAQAEIDRAIEQAEKYKQYLDKILPPQQQSSLNQQDYPIASANQALLQAQSREIYQSQREPACTDIGCIQPKEPLQTWNLRELDSQMIANNPQSQVAISITAAQVARDWLQQQGKPSPDGRTLVATGNHYEATEDQQTRTLTFSRVASGGERNSLLTLNRQTGELSLEQPFTQEDISRLQATQQLLAQAQMQTTEQLAQAPALDGR